MKSSGFSARSDFEAYSGRYADIGMARSDGILELTFGTDGGPFIWSRRAHRELPLAFADIAGDPETLVVILTGTGAKFCDRMDMDSFADCFSPVGWSELIWEGRRMLGNLLDIEVPVIAAVNGPATMHPELPLLSDIVLAADTAFFRDDSHLSGGIVPGDGVHLVWTRLFGANRGRYLLLTHQGVSAEAALASGAVAEILPVEALLPRARQLAAGLLALRPLTLRHTRLVFSRFWRDRLREDGERGLALEGLAALDLAAAGKR
jgi:enoyl-CoA hydratase/carnithine racemase